MKLKKEEKGVEQPVTVEREILKVNLRKDTVESVRDEVVVEGRMELYVNDEHYAAFLFSPSEARELVVGHLLAERIICSLGEIMRLDIAKGRSDVYLTKKTKFGLSRKPRLTLTPCGNETPKIPPRLWMKGKLTENSPSIRLNAQTIISAAKLLNSQACVFRRTGGTHASALLDENGRLLAVSEDIGRHNAIDKIIGKAALEGLDFKRTLLASTGRLTSEMVIKAANVGIPVIVSISAPTDEGIKLAEMVGLTLIGFVRGRRFNIYTYHERIEEPLCSQGP